MFIFNKSFILLSFKLSKFYNLLEIYFFSVIKQCFLRFVQGFLVKNRKLFVFFNSLFLHFLVFFLKQSSFLQATSLMDICVVDFPKRISNRFELSYVF
jgi:hypothetical protein